MYNICTVAPPGIEMGHEEPEHEGFNHKHKCKASPGTCFLPHGKPLSWSPGFGLPRVIQCCELCFCCTRVTGWFCAMPKPPIQLNKDVKFFFSCVRDVKQLNEFAFH